MSDAPSRQGGLLCAVLLAWMVASAIHWPAACTFRDEVGYIGQARLLLAGSFRPEPDSVCYSLKTPDGEVAEYPPFFPLILAPLFAASPRAVFVPALLSALLLAVACGLGVARLGGRATWGALALLHPTVLLLSRTAMADVALAALALAAWLSLDSKRRAWAPAIFALLVLIKPTGVVIAALLLLGALLERRGTERALPVGAAAGTAAGLGLALLLNVLATGGIAYAYSQSAQEFTLSALPTSGGAHLRTLFLAPPLLILGAVPLWKRRDLGPLLVIVGLTAMMSLYRFVDSGRTSIETLFLAPRLILPAVAFLLVGWGLLLDRLASRWKLASWAPALLIVAAPVAAYQAGSLHTRLLAPHASARRAAEDALAARGGTVLGVTPNAFKAGVLSRHPVRAVVPGAAAPEVVLCSSETDSVRDPGAANDCDVPGYEASWRGGRFAVLSRPPWPAGTSPARPGPRSGAP